MSSLVFVHRDKKLGIRVQGEKEGEQARKRVRAECKRGEGSDQDTNTHTSYHVGFIYEHLWMPCDLDERFQGSCCHDPFRMYGVGAELLKAGCCKESEGHIHVSTSSSHTCELQLPRREATKITHQTNRQPAHLPA